MRTRRCSSPVAVETVIQMFQEIASNASNQAISSEDNALQLAVVDIRRQETDQEQRGDIYSPPA